MIAAAVPTETIMNAAGQAQAGGQPCAADAGFNALLDMLMTIQPQAAQPAPAQSAETPAAELVELVSTNANEAEAESMPVQDLIQELAQWMQPQARPDGEAAAPVIELTPGTEADSNVQAGASAAKTESGSNAMPLPAAIVAALMTATHTQKVITETVTPNDEMTNAATAAIRDLVNPAEANVPDASLVKIPAAPETAPAAVIANVAKTIIANAAEGVVNAPVVAVANADGNPKSPLAKTENPGATADAADSTDQAAVINMAALAAAIAPQQSIVAKTTTAEPETASAKSSTTTVTAQPSTAQAKPAVATIIPAVPQPEAATSGPGKWNLSELIHRFDESLRQVMTEQPANTPQTTQTTTEEPVATAPKTQMAQIIADAVTPKIATATATKPSAKTEKTIDSTVTAAAQPQVQTWQPEPVQADSNTTRMPHLIEQVRQASQWLAEKAEGTIRVGDHGVEANMKLYPPDMGGVRVSLNVGSDLNVQAQFVAERPETALALRQNMSQLQESFARQGLTLDSVKVVVAPAASSQSGSAGQQSSDAPRRDPQSMQQNRQFENRNSQERRQRQQA
ncbi:flagellar hook-length control protein FliK [bacterium]|nr:flagellar hook-length control protein FliK [bacterium]